MKKTLIMGSLSHPLQEEVKWENISPLSSKKYVCGFCSNPLAANQGFFAQKEHVSSYIYICHHCNRPTFFDTIGNQYPGPIYGNSVKHLPPDVQITRRKPL